MEQGVFGKRCRAFKWDYLDAAERKECSFNTITDISPVLSGNIDSFGYVR
jgi:hypothetical protein